MRHTIKTKQLGAVASHATALWAEPDATNLPSAAEALFVSRDFFLSLSHRKESYHLRILNKIYL